VTVPQLKRLRLIPIVKVVNAVDGCGVSPATPPTVTVSKKSQNK
jgi:hypothetical protein